ncbi:hypothetical protein BGX33_005441 [Mortierella sp. NVP41]|nr:hypothetical protein BGX33_005441 [Mortierella sp. NVP41]
MTLISSSVPIDTFYCNNNSLDQNNTHPCSPQQALSWLQFQPATVSTTTSTTTSNNNNNNKYRTLASIQAQTLQQHLLLLNNSNNDSLSSPVSPTSIKPSILDTQTTTIATLNPININTTTTTTTPKNTSSITAALQEMDASHGTCFLTWIHNPTNLDYISLRLRPLCLEYPLVDVANVLRWIGADWSSTDCKALFRAVTSNWDQSKRRILAFLLIRDEEMRQKAKSKLVEFAQKSSSGKKSTQLRTPGSSSSPQQQQHIQHQRIQPSFHFQQRLNLQQQQHQQQQQRKQLHQVQSVSVGSPSVSVHNYKDSPSNNNASWRGVNLTSLENIAAASLITGIDMTLPLSTSSLLPVACAPPTTTTTTTTTTVTTNNNNLYSRRFSPY